MKLLPLLLCNAVLVVGAIAVYDQVRSDGASTAYDLGGDTLDVRALERRLAALEAQRAPALGATAPADWQARLAAVEARLAVGSPAADEAPADDEAPTASATAHAPAAAPDRPDGVPADREPTAKEIAAFRRLQSAAREWERANRHRIRIDKALVGLDVRLSEPQRTKLAEAYAAFQPRRSAIWAEAKRSGMTSGPDTDWDTVVREVSARITREFSAQISGFVAARDADRIAGALYGNTK